MMKHITRRQFAWGAFAATAAATVPLTFNVASCEAEASPLPFVDAELRSEARRILGSGGSRSELTRKSLKHLRAALAPRTTPPSPDTAVLRRLIPVGEGHPEAAIYVVNARPGLLRPAVIHMHGGGFIAGSAQSAVPGLQALARRLECVVIGVEYRLAPEATYLGSTADNYAALRWLHKHAGELGVDPNRIVVMGESAGGGHAALLARIARDNGLQVALQVLVYPMLDDRTGTTHEPKHPLGTIGWSAQDNRFAWKAFLRRRTRRARCTLGRRSRTVHRPDRVAADLHRSGSIDLFFEENVAYANRLFASGVATELVVVPGAFHGFDAVVPGASVSQSFEKARWDALRKVVGAVV